MGSVRQGIVSALSRCVRGSCYGLGFISSAIFLLVMFWILWCYLGLVSIQTTDTQRRALVHYSITSTKPTTPAPTPAVGVRPKDAWNSTAIDKQSPPGVREDRSDISKDSRSRVDPGLPKSDFDPREKGKSNATSSRSSGTQPSTDTRGIRADSSSRSDGKLAVILSGHEDSPRRELYDVDRRRPDADAESITVRVVSASAPENRAEDAGRTDIKPTADRPKTDARDYVADDRRKPESTPVRGIDDDISRSRRPVDRDIYDDERSIRRKDDYDKDRLPPRDYLDAELERDRRLLEPKGSRREPIGGLNDGERRRDSYDREPPRRRYDDIDDKDYDRLPPRRGDSGTRDRARIPESRRDAVYDRPLDRDDRYRDRIDDDRYTSRARDDRYRDDDDRYRSRPIDDRYPSRRDEDYRSSDDTYVRDRRVDDRYTDDEDRYRDRVPDDRYNGRDEVRRVDERYRDRVDDDRYDRRREPVVRDGVIRSRTRDEIDPVRPVDPVVERRPISTRDERPLTPVREPLDDVRTTSTRRRDEYDADGRVIARPYDRDDIPLRTTADRDDRYVERSRDEVRRDRPSRYDDVDGYRPVDRDSASRAEARRPVDDSRYSRTDDPDRRRLRDRDDISTDRYRDRVVDDYDKGYRRRDYDDDYKGSRSSVNKGDERISDRDRPVYVAEDRDPPRGLSVKPEEVILDQRSYSTRTDDYARNRPRLDPKLSRDDADDKYLPPRRRGEDRDLDDRYVSRTRSRLDDDDDDYRTKGDYGRDRRDPYDRTDDRRYSRRDSTYDDPDYLDDRYSSGSSRARNRTRDGDLPARTLDDSRPLRSSDDRLPPREYPSDGGRYASDSRPPPRRRVEDDIDAYKSRDAYPETYSSGSESRPAARETVRPVIREKRYQEQAPPFADAEQLPRPLSPKEVIDAAYRHTDVSDKPREVIYPVYDPRVTNITSPEVIRPSERRGTTITTK